MILATNKKIACSVPENTGRTMRTTDGFGAVEHKDGGLMALTVVFGTNYIEEGSTVYLSEQDKQQPWASLKYKLDGKEFVLVPEDRILLIKEK